MSFCSDVTTFSPSEILKIAQVIHQDTVRVDTPSRMIYYSEKYPEFTMRYPKLFSCACDPKFDMRQLQLMLSNVDKLKNDEITREEAMRSSFQPMAHRMFENKDLNKTAPPATTPTMAGDDTLI